ncbi:hypothetical protein [Streptomyces jeddahensis]|uniref:hypothetical protein n=1 Tax=Streptomyces jeddahensis TaxID=1716141 RepID=UPI000A7C6307|nr:hypothetical protein [Streptomyces jeddahensis]
MAIDARLDPGATTWDSAADELPLGNGDLDRLRDARSAAGGCPVETSLAAYELGSAARS